MAEPEKRFKKILGAIAPKIFFDESGGGSGGALPPQETYFLWSNTTATIAFFMILGRTDLRTGVSEAKFDVEADFDVEKFLAPQKSSENLGLLSQLIAPFNTFI